MKKLTRVEIAAKWLEDCSIEDARWRLSPKNPIGKYVRSEVKKFLGELDAAKKGKP